MSPRTASALGRAIAIAALAAVLAPSRALGDDAVRESAAPSWLRAPATRGPLSSVLAFDGRWAYGSAATGLPLGTRLRARDADRSPRPAAPGYSVNAIFAASGEPGTGDRSGSWLRGALLLDRSGPRSGSWLGLASGEGRSQATSQVMHRVGVGVWRTLSPLQFEGSIVTSVVQFHGDPRWSRTVTEAIKIPADTSRFLRDTSYTVIGDHLARWFSGQGAARWQRGRLELEASGGITAGVAAPRRGWAQVAAGYQLSRRILLLGSFGTRPATSLAFDPAGRPRSMVGVQVAPWSSSRWAMASAIGPTVRSLVTRRAGGGQTAFFIRCRDAKQVELAGDFTDWIATGMSPAGGGWWQLVVPVSPGLHRVRVRLDGRAWEAPPGLPRAADADLPAGVLLVE